ncbi:MAG: DUF2784 domain-containing protein [Bacteroidales bacterium]|nr:DUF2784 domain-containing protein [Bacteroidales bacterium]
MLNQILDVFFLLFHTSLTLFNALGWIWKPLRKINLLTLLLTGSSWFVLGLFYGMGYCPLTDWHFRVLRNMGRTNLPDSYLQYLTMRFFHWPISASIIDFITAAVFFLALSVSLWLNIRDWKHQRKGLPSHL